MKSFPSTFNRGGNSVMYRGKSGVPETNNQSSIATSLSNSLLQNVQSKNLNKGLNVKQFLLNGTNISNYDRRLPFKMVGRTFVKGNRDKNRSGVYFENPEMMPSFMLRSMNTYRFIYDVGLNTKFDSTKEGDVMSVRLLSTSTTPSMFNPQFNVQAVGLTKNVPLLFTNRADSNSRVENIGDCSIKRLVSDSMSVNSPLGMARYRLADFMYCKDLGKVSNNHLITLRKFPFPVNDHIFEYANAKYHFGSDGDAMYQTGGDVGRLISWFGTDDNKLEDICKFETQFTWKEIKNQIQERDSKEDNQNKGIIGKIANTLNPSYNKYQLQYGGTKWNFVNDLGSHMFPHLMKYTENADDNSQLMSQTSDNNRVWTPKNIIADNTIPEGKLVLKQEFTLNFSYKLRAYENINPKSAFLDLIGNILETTYFRGHYWKGERRIIGPPGNQSAWKKANALIDNAWFKLGGFVQSMAAGTMHFGDILGALSNFASNLVDSAQSLAQDIVNDPKAMAQKTLQELTKLSGAIGLGDMIKGKIKDGLGRPAMYAFDSLIEGDNFGPWHLTVGNPYNPIMAIGNLCLTNTTIVQSGPLGIDDFPSEIKVTCTLKPARSRDLTEIAKYYTKGLTGLYLSRKRQDNSSFYKTGLGTSNSSTNTQNIMTYSEIRKKNQAYNKAYESQLDASMKTGEVVNAQPQDAFNEAGQQEYKSMENLYAGSNRNAIKCAMINNPYLIEADAGIQEVG